MFKIDKKLFRKLTNIAVVVAIATFLLHGVIKLTYADSSQGGPDVVVEIDRQGKIHSTGSIFGEELWYPGIENSGVIRVVSDRGPCKISSIKVDVQIAGSVKESFLKNMILTIRKGNMLVFEDTIINQKSLGELSNGMTLDAGKQFLISKGYPVDLEYTLKMAEEAGEELENVKAHVTFSIGVDGEEKPQEEQEQQEPAQETGKLPE